MNKKQILFIFIFLTIGIILYSIYYLCKSKLETFENLIPNGNFNNGEMSNDSLHNIGNATIIMENPGDSSYVLKQSALTDSEEKTRYQLNLEINPGKTYKIKCWVTYDEDWDGNFNLFNILTYNNCGKTDIISANGILIDRKQINDYIWELREHTFSIPSNSIGKIEIYLGYDPKNTIGSRYIANVSLNRDHGIINNTPLVDDIIVFLSAHHNNSINSDTKIWKDASTNGNDFYLDKETIIDDKYVDLKISHINGPQSKKLIPNDRQFTIFFSGISEEYTTGEIFSLYSNNVYNIGLNIILQSNIGVDNKMIVEMIGNKYIFNLGITQKHCIYALVINLDDNDNKLSVYIDGYKLKPDIEKIAAWNNEKQETYYPEDNLKLNDLNSIMANPDKGNLKFKIDFFIIYSKEINSNQVVNITNYLSSFRKDEQYSKRPDTSKCVCNDGNQSNNNSNVDTSNNSTSNNMNITNIQETSTTKIVCPFKSTDKNSPCYTLECCGANWNDIQNVSSKCKMNINTYCKGNNDNTCSILLSEKKIRENRTCKGSKKILESLSKETSTKIDSNLKIESESCIIEKTEKKNDIPLKICKTNAKISEKTKKKKIIRGIKDNYIENAKSCNIDMSKYIRKDKIPCWGCNLDNITK